MKMETKKRIYASIVKPTPKSNPDVRAVGGGNNICWLTGLWLVTGSSGHQYHSWATMTLRCGNSIGTLPHYFVPEMLECGA